MPALDHISLTTPIVLPSSLKEIKSLIFQHQNQQSEATNFLPLPDLVSAPKMLVPLENEAVIPSILERRGDSTAEEG